MRGDAGTDVFADLGKSGLRVQVHHGTSLRTRTGDGISPTQRGDLGEILGRGISALLAQEQTVRVDRVVIGSTSELTAHETASLFRVLRPSVPAAVIAVTDDGTLAHARRLNAPGVLLSVGTGVIAIARSGAGAFRRFDGWGPLSGDRGSAVDVGRRALRSAYRAVDAGIGTPLRDAVAARIGPLGLDTARGVLADERWPALLARIAEDVCAVADAGDDDAARILDDAVEELAGTARMAAEAAGVPEIVVTGRFGTSPAVAARLMPAVRAIGLRPVDPHGDTAVSAREIVVGPYADLLAVDHPADSGVAP